MRGSRAPRAAEVIVFVKREVVAPEHLNSPPKSNAPLPMDDIRPRAMSLGLGLGIGLAAGWALAQRVNCRNHASASNSTRTEANRAAPPAQPSEHSTLEK